MEGLFVVGITKLICILHGASDLIEQKKKAKGDAHLPAQVVWSSYNDLKKSYGTQVFGCVS
jgi:hypothetical protein